MDLSELRQNYQQSTLTEMDLSSNPFKQLALWLEVAKDNQDTPSNAMNLATSNAQGRVSIRMVLLQSIEESKLFFYSNYHSQKAQDMAQNPNIALSFTWLNLERQIHIIGRAKKTSLKKSQAYFTSRPRQSQLGAWASKQSQVLDNRQTLESSYNYYDKKFANQAVPLPDFWGGYEVEASSVEFWQGGQRRLHDRFIYQKDNNNFWHTNRLCP